MDFIGKKGAVCSSDPLAVAAGLELLRRGGNAVDAAVGTVLVECVVQPNNTGLGGYGGTMTLYIAGENRATSIDFDGVAPLAAKPDMFEVEAEVDPAATMTGTMPVKDSLNEYGYLALCVPGNVGGLAHALRKYGTMSWTEVSARALELAENGFPIGELLASRIRDFAEKADELSKKALFGGSPVPGEGDLFIQKDLAKLLHKLAQEGPEAFYGEEIAGAIVKQVREHGGILQMEDFTRFSPDEAQPISVKCGDFELCTSPLPGGGLTSLQIAAALYELGVTRDDLQSGRYHHLFVEVGKPAWAERLALLGDPHFIEDPTPGLLSKEHISAIAAQAADGPTDTTVGQRAPLGHTVHTVAGDGAHNFVSVTCTQGNAFGSRVVIDGLGLVLGHGMSRFDPMPGTPNSIAPGKRMLHNMSPMLLMENGRIKGVFGLPGGRRIVNVAAQMAVAFMRFGMTPHEAIAAPRVHTEGHEPTLVDSTYPAELADALKAYGHTTEPFRQIIGGPASAIMIDSITGSLRAASQRGDSGAGAF